jgi:hypothetical protein
MVINTLIVTYSDIYIYPHCKDSQGWMTMKTFIPCSLTAQKCQDLLKKFGDVARDSAVPKWMVSGCVFVGLASSKQKIDMEKTALPRKHIYKWWVVLSYLSSLTGGQWEIIR